MYSCQDTQSFYYDETRNSSTESDWAYDQNQITEYYESCQNTGPIAHYYGLENHLAWTQDPTYVKQETNFETQQFQHGFFPQHASLQYVPLRPEPGHCSALHPPRPHQNVNIMAKRHRAQISFLPSKSGNFKTIVKRKRKRTVFTTEQLEALEAIFKTKQYITRDDRLAIVSQLQLNEKSVKIWFQNRRLKGKKGPESPEEEFESSSNSLEERHSPDIARLEYVESQINEKADELGFVKLDDSLMQDLFNVVDDFLTNNTSVVPEEDSSESDRSLMYEPISPASASDSNGDETTPRWKPSEPNESLQRLFDLQSMLSL